MLWKRKARNHEYPSRNQEMHENSTKLHRPTSQDLRLRTRPAQYVVTVTSMLIIVVLYFLLSIDTTSSKGSLGNNGVDDRVSLVVGFWIEPNGDDTTSITTNRNQHHHRAEVETAMLANLENRYLNELVVILDSTTKDANCQHFLQRMEKLRQERKHYTPHTHDVDLKCIDRPEDQPTYFEMFNYTLSEEVTGSVVIMSNGDQAFDDTLKLARYVNLDTILFLSTWGYNQQDTPSGLRDTYLSRHERDDTIIPGFCYNWRNHFRGTPGNYSLSWDTYIYRTETIRHSLESRHFKRMSYKRQWVPFYMNELGAENAALHGLVHDRSSWSVWNACKLIRTWHFHLAPKTHRHDTKIWPKQIGNDTMYMDPYWEAVGRVPTPEANAPVCQNLFECRDAFYNISAGPRREGTSPI